MRKTVYSLVLTPEIIEAVDRLAYAQGTSRSNLIDCILADAVGYVTPQQHMQQMFDTLMRAVGGDFQPQERSGGEWLVLRRQLRYRYKPTIRYRVELFREDDECYAILQASFRTRSEELLREVNEFFRLYTMNELAYGQCCSEDILHENDRWCRRIRMTDEQLQHPKLLGDSLANYIRRFDTLLQRYFAALPDRRYAMSVISEAFQRSQ